MRRSAVFNSEFWCFRYFTRLPCPAMSWLVQYLIGAVAALFENLQTSTLQLITNPAQLSAGDVIILGASVLVGAAVWWVYQALGWKRGKPRTEFTPGKVYIHAVPPVKIIPCLAPFEMKLLTYVRMADIPHEVIYGFDNGPKDKIPWIEYNGEAMGDSGLIIEFLNKEKGVDLNKNLSDTDRAVSRAFTKMLEENTYWGFIQGRWIDNCGQMYVDSWKLPIYVWPMFRLMRRRIKKMMWAHGIGRHSKDELESIMENDLKALSSFLGTKPYLMGEEPTEVDAAVFGQLSQLVWALPHSCLHRIVTQDCPNLQAYCVRMKERYWPDWDQLTGNTKKDQ